MRTLTIALSLLLALSPLAGCDRDSGDPAGSASTGAPNQARQPTTVVEVQPVTPLVPGRRTHVAPDGQGRLFWVQESQTGSIGTEVVFVLSDGALPQSTKLTGDLILEALGQASFPAGDKQGAGGSIQSLACGPDGKLYFFFSGGKGKMLLAAFGSFDARTSQVQILADSTKLEALSGMVGLALARGTVIRSGDLLWLWLRHSDGYALLSLEPARATGVELRRPFARVLSATSESPNLTLTATDDLVAAGAGNALLFWDRGINTAAARVWKIETNGSASVLRVAAEVPSQSPPPGLDDRGNLVFLAPASPDSSRQYPALILVGEGSRVVLGRERFEAPARVRLGDLTPAGLWRDRSGWVTYDTVTGELLRVRVVER